MSHNQIRRASWRATARWEVNVVQAINIPLMLTAFLMGPGPQESELQAHSLLKTKKPAQNHLRKSRRLGGNLPTNVLFRAQPGSSGSSGDILPSTSLGRGAGSSFIRMPSNVIAYSDQLNGLSIFANLWSHYQSPLQNLQNRRPFLQTMIDAPTIPTLEL